VGPHVAATFALAEEIRDIDNIGRRFHVVNFFISPRKNRTCLVVVRTLVAS